MIQIVKLASSGQGMIHPKLHQAKGLVFPSLEYIFLNPKAVLDALGPDDRTNIFYTVAHHTGVGTPQPSRKNATFDHQDVIAFDIDNAVAERAYEYLAVVADLFSTPPATLTLISTGGGVHVIIHLAKPIRQVEDFKKLKPAYNEVCHKIKLQMDRVGLPGKVDPVVFEAARVLRLPGTINRKPTREDSECKLLQFSAVKLDVDLYTVSGLDKIKEQNISPEEIRRSYPKPDLEEMARACNFIRWCTEKPEEVHEPQAFDLYSLLAVQNPESKADLNGQQATALEIARYVHTHATSSLSLQAQDFDAKWEGSKRYGARKCKTIEENGFDGCKECPHFGRVPTPLALKSKEHIGSEQNGFWVMNAKDKPQYPNYADLVKVYKRENSYITTSEERVWAFNNECYTKKEPIHVRAWVDQKVVPNDPLREMHRVEFYKRVLAVGTIGKEGEDQLFEKNTRGKLNCKNGVLDIIKGELLPHSPEYGFKYVLPYPYVECDGSEFFMQWLSEITKDRTELMEAILDMMAYTLWPDYDDHIFAFLAGEGSNGKSTLIHILHAMLGRENYSTVSLQQLGNNRFAPAMLEGKLANLSEESSGFDLGLEELNVLKNLSAGGEIYAERKNEQGFTFHNKAKLIFSANRTPRFREHGDAIVRRMLIIPFEHKISNPDPNVERQLIKEVPKIVPMLIRRIQANLREHNGAFKVYRGGEVARNATERVLTEGDSVVSWAKDELVISEDAEKVIEVSEAYARYKEWAMENGYRQPVVRSNFSRTMYRWVLSIKSQGGESKVKKVGGKPVRVFEGVRWKASEELTWE